MKEVVIFIVLVFFTGVVYWGVEPLAHSVMHPHVAPANFDFPKEAKDYAKEQVLVAQENLENAQSDIEGISDKSSEDYKSAKGVLDSAKIALNHAQALAKSTDTFWNDVEKIDLSKGDATKGAETFMNAGCIGCHGLKSQGMPAPMDSVSAAASFGVVPPDLSTAGYLYSPKFLAGLIKNPTLALHVEGKFNDTRPFPMTQFYGAGGSDINQEVADIVAYLLSIAPKTLTDKEVFENACQRCHGMKYDKLVALTNEKDLKNYMGSVPPDLSIIIRARSVEYLETFINDPQKGLPGTSMPRVGLKKQTQEQVVSYLENVGDSKKSERESLGFKIMGYFFILSIFAILWKLFVWRKVH